MSRPHAIGWIAVHRKILDGFAGCDDETLGVWVRLLLSVNWKAKYFGKQRIEPGQILLSDRGMQERLYPSSEKPPAINTIKKRLLSLRDAGLIDIQTVNGRKGGRLVTVKNWAKYQHQFASMVDANTDAVVDANRSAIREANPNANADAIPGADRTMRTRKKKQQINGRNPDSDLMNETYEKALPFAVAACKALDPRARNDRRLIAIAAVLAVTKFSEHWFNDSLGGVTRTRTTKPMGKFHSCLRERASKHHDGADFDDLADAVNVPKTFYDRLDAELTRPKESHAKKAPPTTDTSEAAINARRNEVTATLKRLG